MSVIGTIFATMVGTGVGGLTGFIAVPEIFVKKNDINMNKVPASIIGLFGGAVLGGAIGLYSSLDDHSCESGKYITNTEGQVVGCAFE